MLRIYNDAINDNLYYHDELITTNDISFKVMNDLK